MVNKPYEISLIRSAQGGDSASFAELYNLYYQKVFAFIRTIVRNSADAEDILQLTFLNAWRTSWSCTRTSIPSSCASIVNTRKSTVLLRIWNFVLVDGTFLLCFAITVYHLSNL